MTFYWKQPAGKEFLLTVAKKSTLSKTFSSKREDMIIDREHYFRTLINNMMVRASWAETVKSLSGITGVSQVWDRQPEWYIWISGKPGPYALTLEHTTGWSTGTQDVHRGQFAVKCFPHPEHAVSKCYSEAEQQLLKSDRFDQTRTPVFEKRAQIPPSFFTIAGLTVTSCPDSGISVFTFDSMDSIRLVNTGTTGVAASTARRCDENLLLRSIPGWKIGYPLFDSLISLYAFSSRLAPQWFRLSRSPGFEHVLSADETIIDRPSSQCRVFSVSLLFVENAMIDAHQWLPEIEAGEEVLSESRHDSCAADSKDIPNPPMNPLWQHLAQADIVSELSSLCGCCDHVHPAGSCKS
jgi:hypothetical protein